LNAQYWWMTDKARPGDVANIAFKSLQRLEQTQKRRQEIKGFEDTYNAENSNGTFSYMLPSTTIVPPALVVAAGRISYNLERSLVQAFRARVASERARARFLASGGTYSDRLAGRQLTFFAAGLARHSKMYQTGNQVALDGLISGTGWFSVGQNWLGTDISTTKAHPCTVYVDCHKYSIIPHTYYMVRYASKTAMAKAMGKYKEIIHTSACDIEQGDRNDVDDDTVCMIESWHLDEPVGRHIIACSAGTLLDEDWKYPRPGVVGFRFSKPTKGFYGQGVIQDVADLSEEINITLRKMQEAMNFHSTHILLGANSGLTRKHINNTPFSVFEYMETGKPPSILQIPGITPEQIQWVRYCTEQAYERIGMSQLWATSEKPAGLNSGKALNEYNDINSERFKDVLQDIEQMYVDVAEIQVDCAREIYKREGKYSVKLPLYDTTTEIDWSEINLERDKYVVKAFAVSLLSEEPAARLQEAVDIATTDPAMAIYLLEMLDEPDIAAVVARKLTDQMLVEKIIEAAHKGKDLPAPDIDMGEEFLTAAIAQFTRAYLQCFLSEESDDVKNAITGWIMQAKGVLAPPPPPEMPLPMPPAGGETLPPPGMDQSLPPMAGQGLPPELAGAAPAPGMELPPPEMSPVSGGF
jgi:hypothetical protein